MTKEQKFLNALKDIFVGAKVEGESGFINLMRIKSCYFEKGVFPRLIEDINKALEPFPEFREELFDRLYTFFHRYFSETGSIYYRHTPLHERVYEQVYTDDRDVMLFWKTHMLYYVKTDRLFKSMEIEVDGFRFFFDVSSLEHKKNNEKRELVYSFKEIRSDGAIIFDISYSEKGRKTKLDDIRKGIKNALGLPRYTDQVPGEEVLERAFRTFKRQSEVDYFICKDARKFLREQFDLWLYQYVFEPEYREEGSRGGTIWSEKRIRQLQVLKDIAYKIIDYIAQFEDELIRIWNKPKFVLNSHYVITLDRIIARDGGTKLLNRFLSHHGMETQIQEWRDLGIVDDSFTLEDIKNNLYDPRYLYLPLDTRHFKDLELDLLLLFDHLDKELDGWLIKSENYQALNTLLPKFRESIQTIYIDPPFNTGDDFNYVDRFQDSTWLTLMDNRLSLAKHFLKQSGSIFLHLDWNANYLGRLLLDKTFGKNGFVNEIIWRIGWVSGYKTQAKGFVRNHDTILFYTPDEIQHFFKKEDAVIPYCSFAKDTISEHLSQIVEQWCIPKESVRTAKVVFHTTDGTVFKIGLKTKQGEYYLEDTWNCNEYEELHSNKIKRNAKEYTPNGSEITQKPEELLKRVIELTTDDGDIVFDFFMGSATTIAVAHKLHRRWIGIEMADYFETDALYRMKHVLAGRTIREPVGISAQVDWQGGGFFKYFALEQHEDVLRRAYYADVEPIFVQTDPYSQYVFLRDTKMLDNAQTGEKVMMVDLEKNEIRVDLSKLYDNIDLAETLSCVTGKWIRRIYPRPDDSTQPGEVEFEDGTRVNLTNPPWELFKTLIWW
ncbi:Modification methylase MboII [Koleobacter methoxysyntrophicus]|uniref:Modification methylase MboII n=1 Tax=Koleobacter methoxysyntrophicus TaxID=2751313 RepID=A0A8A0RRI5_9FIRM|nr:site-specific DNA-methyltransferase [Koleobacter methoxysyntrophicus]QSQ10512.1 Modification methylase MboII [Koleobacter methoxysyntrophicus]